MRLHNVSFFSPFSLLSKDNFEPTTGVLTFINDNLSSVVLLILEEAQCTVKTLNNESEFLVLRMNVKLLVGFVLESVNLKLAILGDSQALGLIKD